MTSGLDAGVPAVEEVGAETLEPGGVGIRVEAGEAAAVADGEPAGAGVSEGGAGRLVAVRPQAITIASSNRHATRFIGRYYAGRLKAASSVRRAPALGMA